MGPHFFTHPISSDVKWNHLKMGVNGVDPRFKFVGTKRKADSSIHTGNPSSLENALYVIDEVEDLKANTNVKETELHHQDFSLSPLYPQCYSSVLDNLTAPWQLLNLSKKPLGYKKIKRTVSMPETNVGNSLLDGGSFPIRRNFSTNSLPKLQFRDHIWTYTQRYLAAEAIDNAMLENGMVENEGNVDGMHLVQLLISCAEAVACRDKAHATNLLAELRANALVFGSSFQRVASCFMQGLTDRLVLVQPLGAVGLVAPTTNVNNVIASEKKEEALRLVYEVCPQIKFGHFVANLTILEAFEGESFVHVVDLGLTLGLAHGHQWRDLIDNLANDVSQAVRRIRITAIGPCANRFRTIGDELEAYARELSVNLEFSVVESSLETLQPEDIKTYENEVLVVNSILQLHCVVKESRGALNSVLQIIHELCPKVLVLVEQDSSHNGPFFLGRFMEALYYYSAIFDALDAMLPKYDTRRAKIEQFYFAEEIKNIVSCEGPNRVERHERVDQWRRRMSRAGFQAAPVKLVARAKQWLAKLEICDGYTIVEEKGSLVLGWKSKPIVAVSCWKC